jgi:hypothetical protein
MVIPSEDSVWLFCSAFCVLERCRQVWLSLLITMVFLNLCKCCLNCRNHIWNNFPETVKLFPAVSRGRWCVCVCVLISWGRLVLTPGGSNTLHIYTQIIYRTTQWTQTLHRTTQFTNYEECGPCPVFARYTLAFALQLKKKHEKTSVRVVGECQLAWWQQNIQKRAYKQKEYINITKRIRKLQN